MIQIRLYHLILSVIVLSVISCNGESRKKHQAEIKKVSPQNQVKPTAPKSEKVIQILPLGAVHTDYINEIQSAIKKFYGYNSIVLPRVERTEDIMAASNTRYEAGKILEKYGSKEYRLIITEEDIAYPNEQRKSKEWGIFGLGDWKGTTCVVSTFRLGKKDGKLVSHELLMERLNKIALHEIGHNLGLDHCSNDPHCLMNDANGTIKQVDKERIWFCDRCRKQVH